MPDLTSSVDATSLETPRLLLRRWQSEDLEGVAAVSAQPEVMRYIHDGRTLDRAATAERLATYQRHWDEHGFGLYAVELKETGELAGFTGLAVPTFLPEMPSQQVFQSDVSVRDCGFRHVRRARRRTGSKRRSSRTLLARTFGARAVAATGGRHPWRRGRSRG